MDFWMTVVIVLLLCTVINLPFFVMELREDQRKKQKRNPAPVQPQKPESQPTEEKKVQEQKLQPPVVGKCGDGLTWRKEGDILYIEGHGQIEDEAFCYDQSIRKVVIAPGCTGIGEEAFGSCDQLQEAELPEGLLRIGKGAFSCCGELAAVTLPDGLQEIGEDAFWSCEHKDLKLHIPDTVTEIGKNAFWFVPEIDYFGPAWDEWNWGADNWVTIHDTCDSGNWKIKDNTLYVYVNGELSLKEFEVAGGYFGYTETVFRSPSRHGNRNRSVCIFPL